MIRKWIFFVMKLIFVWAIIISSAHLTLVACGWLNNFKSYFGEVCHAPSVQFNLTGLRTNLESKVFGQPFLQKLLIPLLKLHLDDTIVNRKALVMSFHGTPGSGKNYVAKIIAENIYKSGMDSQFVHLFKPVIHFSGHSSVDLKKKLQDWIIGNVTSCNRQLFIFDEIQDMPEGVLEAVKGFIDYNPRFSGLDFSKCIFLFLSNIAMMPINQRVLELWQKGLKRRERLEHDDFAALIIKHSFNEDGGLKKCKLISNRLIDAFVPFLPLEKHHVADCIKVIAEEYSNIPISQNILKDILDKVEFTPDDIQVFSTHGCKNLDTPIKLALIKSEYELKDEL